MVDRNKVRVIVEETVDDVRDEVDALRDEIEELREEAAQAREEWEAEEDEECDCDACSEDDDELVAAAYYASEGGGGTKYDNGKPPIGLIPRSAIEEEALVLAFGAEVYGADNWRGGFAWRRLIDAALRHVFAIADGEDYDPDSGLLHAAHARCMLGFLIEHIKGGLGTDDRYVR